jgi:hypothetical protein
VPSTDVLGRVSRLAKTLASLAISASKAGRD